jgi:hypothetical protein
MSSPQIPDSNKAAVAGSVEDLINYPTKYQIDQLAKMGGKAVINGKEYDFTGLGDAATANIMSDKMAQALLDIQKNYGADFVKQRIEDLKRSDPNGFAARKQLFDKILEDANKSPDRPLNDSLQAEINAELSKGGQLDSREAEQVREGVRGGQVARGITLGNAPVSQEASAMVKASDDVRTQRQQSAEEFLKSGVSPEDVAYRQIQQSLTNLGAFVSGTTPEAQFGQLAGAQNGAAPFTSTGSSNIVTDPNAARRGLSNATQMYQLQQNNANPWLSALSTLSSIGGVAGGLGWQPFAGGGYQNNFGGNNAGLDPGNGAG